MLSATGITAALAILAISATVTDSDPMAPGSESDSSHIVAADGSGDFSTIGAAVEAAEPGDTVKVTPGTYTESVVIDKDLTVIGDGRREDIIVMIPEDGPSLDTEGRQIGYAFQLLGADTSLGGITIKGDGPRTVAITAEGGTTVLHDLSVELEQLAALPRVFAFVGDGAEAIVRDNHANAELAIGDAVATVTGNVTTGPDAANGLVVWLSDAADVELSGNYLNGVVVEGGTARLVQNELFAPDGCALAITGKEALVTASENLIRSSETGICTSGSAASTIEGNDIVDNGTGVSLGSDASVNANELHENDVAILIRVGSPTIEGNDVSGNRAALAFGTLPTSPSFSGNSFCVNEVLFEGPDGVEPPSLDDNESC
jgi:F-box protein 11